ncbi:MAG: hypothetical protein PHN72_04630 [Bacilli bacterium]|nr:hypothetical protein [Bacilli bacterium]
MQILLGYIFTYLFIFGILLFTDILKKKTKCTDETSRKIVHIFVSFTWIIMIYFFKNTWHLLIPPITFVILNYISYKKNIFKMMERTESPSLGTVYYPISMVLLSILTIIDIRFIAPYGIGLFCMAIGDGLAPYFGQKFKSYKFKIFSNQKTLYGTLTVFLCSLLIINLFTFYYHLPLSVVEIILLSLFSALLEWIGTKGLDNLFLPVGIALLSYLFILF